MWSPVPLRAEDEDGSKEPVSLELSDQGDSYTLENPLAEVRISKRAGEGIALPDLGVRVLPEAAAGAAEPEVIADKLFWANVALDTDLLVRPVAEGVETFHQLRSEDSPEDLELGFELPAGAVLRETDEGAEIVQDGRAVARIAPPTAVDA